MSVKNGVVLLFIFILLGGYLLIIGPNLQKEKTARLFTFDPGKVQEIKLQREGILFRFYKQDSKWVIHSPLYNGPTSPEVVNGFLGLLEYGIINVININSADLAEFGLEKPFAELSIKLKGENNFITLLIGNYSPTGSSCYAKIKGEPSVFLLGSAFRWEFERDIYGRVDRFDDSKGCGNIETFLP